MARRRADHPAAGPQDAGHLRWRASKLVQGGRPLAVEDPHPADVLLSEELGAILARAARLAPAEEIAIVEEALAERGVLERAERHVDHLLAARERWTIGAERWTS